ncbi:MAG: hypothetical protein KBA60_07305 [Flavobacteriales bacterium]|nr:hypothetical protein [Flavobacteriales bacterium]MBP6643526.1 hypothetical protein [Flavobacteriales bacterium]MBP7155798.1 hypothetical protein [Flavobacteriales bacterium]HQV76548.1 hypothetical protein [Flavobacteriales bacterium]HQW42240.1 hypothetical protein [Flavobacteriales bacterium]
MFNKQVLIPLPLAPGPKTQYAQNMLMEFVVPENIRGSTLFLTKGNSKYLERMAQALIVLDRQGATKGSYLLVTD